MKPLHLLLAVVAASVSTQAQAYCCKTHPSICVATCGFKCCSRDNRLSANAGSSNAMSKIPEADLRAELRAAGSADPDFSAKLRAEIDRRKNTVGSLKSN